MAHGEWIIYETPIFINKLILSIKHDEPMSLIFKKLFFRMTGKLMLYSKCSHAIHILSKNSESPKREPCGVASKREALEFRIDYLLLSTTPRALPDTGEENVDGIPSYNTAFEEDVVLSKELIRLFRNRLKQRKPYMPFIDKSTKWRRLFDTLHLKCCVKIPNDILAIPLSKPNGTFPVGRLGIILLWGNVEKMFLQKRMIQLYHASGLMVHYVDRLLMEHFEVTETTYLPDHQTVGYRSVAILFADIRNFTPITEIARNFDLLEDLKSFMLNFCERMSSIIQEHGGRVHSMAGDGIMALFGEHNTPREAVRNAIEAAKEMSYRFEGITGELLGRERIRDFFRRAYEPMSPRLGIGINFGEVYFDYFGAPGSRVYSPLGDHVNFAQRLESEANRYDEKLFDEKACRLGRMRAPILLSRPAWLAGDTPGEKPPDLHIQVKGKPLSYPVYEVWP